MGKYLFRRFFCGGAPNPWFFSMMCSQACNCTPKLVVDFLQWGDSCRRRRSSIHMYFLFMAISWIFQYSGWRWKVWIVWWVGRGGEQHTVFFWVAASLEAVPKRFWLNDCPPSKLQVPRYPRPKKGLQLQQVTLSHSLLDKSPPVMNPPPGTSLLAPRKRKADATLNNEDTLGFHCIFHHLIPLDHVRFLSILWNNFLPQGGKNICR